MFPYRNLFHFCLGVVFVAGCSSSGDRLSPSAPQANAPVHAEGSQTFKFRGKGQKLQVPPGVERVTITASGASGERCPSGSCQGYGAPGNGGWVKAIVPVAPAETLYVYVGGNNGYNGGAAGSTSGYAYGNGGGASDVRQGGRALKDRVVVAGGGGGGGYIGYNQGVGGGGGAGGGRAGLGGGTGSGYLDSGGGGSPGTQRYGGTGGAGGQYGPNIATPPRCRDGCGHCSGDAGGNGMLGKGGSASNFCGGPGGGGGGGYYGGGGGGSGASSYYGVSFQLGPGGGGGGGSSFIEPHGFDTKEKKGGAAPGNGEIVISW